MLDSLVAPLSVPSFLQSYWGKRPVHVEGDPQRYANLFSWRRLESLLNSGRLPVSSLKLYRDGQEITHSDRLDIVQAIHGGATVIVNNGDHYDSRLARFIDSLSASTTLPARFNIYATPGAGQGFRTHYDTHDVFVLQIDGSKRWRVFPRTIVTPLYFAKTHSVEPPAEDECELDCLVGPGDLLYIPKGHWHYARADEAASLHLTLGLFTRTGVHFLSWLVDELREDENVRGEFMPFVLSKAPIVEVNRPRADDFINTIRRQVDNLLAQPAIYWRYVRHVVATAQNRKPFNFPAQFRESVPLDTSTLERYPHPYLLEDLGAEGITLHVCGKVYRFDKRWRPILTVIFANSSFSGSELLSAGGVSSEELDELLADLTKESIIGPKRA